MKTLRTIALIAGCLAWAAMATEPATACQKKQEQSNSSAGTSIKEKLSSIQQKVKQRIDSLRGIDGSSQTAQPGRDAPVDHFHFDSRRMQSTTQQMAHHRPSQDSQQFIENYRQPVRRSRQQVAQASYVQQGSSSRNQNPTAVPENNLQPGAAAIPPTSNPFYDPRQDYRNGNQTIIAAPPFAVGVPLNQPLSSTSYVMPNQGQPTFDGRSIVAPPPQAQIPQQNQLQSPMPQAQNIQAFERAAMTNNPATVQTSAASVAGQVDPALYQQRSGHYQNGFSKVRTLSDQQLTASQRALQLQASVESLTAQLESMRNENRRLSDMLSENRRMLSRAEQTIGASLKKLQEATENNQILKQRVRRLQAENEAQKNESAQALNSIRKQLDELLIGEISRNQ